MKKLSCLLYFLLACVCISTTACGNKDDEPKKENGNKKIMISPYVPIADPFILLHNNTYYAYGTSGDEGFEVYHSDDLKSWKKHNQMLLKKADSYGDKWFWAPEVYYNSSNKKFYLFYSAEEHICVATGDSPLGPFKQKEKQPMREEKGIDSSLFVDDDGTPYIFFDRFTNGNVIWVARLSDDWLTINESTLTKCIEVSQEWEKDRGKVVEGASVIKLNGLYYLIYSGNDFRSLDYGVGYATATSPLGPWKKAEENPILQRPKSGMVGTGHGAYFRDKDNSYKYVFHSHFDASKVNPRTMHIVNMSIANKNVKFDKNSIIDPYVTN